MRLLIKGGRLLDPENCFDDVLDVLCRDGKIAAIAPELETEAEQVVDASGCVVFPALIDLHVHAGEPGHEPRESLDSLARALVRGGFGTAIVMPDTDPPRQYAADVGMLLARSETLPLRLFPAACLTLARKGEEPTEWGELAEAGAVAIGDNRPVHDTSLVRRALLYLRPWGVPLLTDAVDPYLSRNASAWEGYYPTVYGLRAMPAEAEEAMLLRDLLLARLTEGRLHVQRVATAKAVARIAEAKAQGWNVTAEVSWLHLVRTDESLGSYDTSLKVWPPLGSDDDRRALIEGVRSGVIDAIVTDHTPYTSEEKVVEFDFAPFGAAGAEHAFAALWSELVRPGLIEEGTLLRRLTSSPAKAFNLAYAGVQEGAPADLVVFDPARQWTPTREEQASRAANHPFLGVELTGKVRATVIGGRVQYEAGR